MFLIPQSDTIIFEICIHQSGVIKCPILVKVSSRKILHPESLNAFENSPQQVTRKSKIKQAVKKIFDACKSAGARKIRFRPAEPYAGMSERRILKTTDNNVKYQQPNAKLSRVLSR